MLTMFSAACATFSEPTIINTIILEGELLGKIIAASD